MTKKKITNADEYEEAREEIKEARREEMRRLFEQGWTLEQIAAQFSTKTRKYSVSAISKIIKGDR